MKKNKRYKCQCVMHVLFFLLMPLIARAQENVWLQPIQVAQTTLPATTTEKTVIETEIDPRRFTPAPALGYQKQQAAQPLETDPYHEQMIRINKSLKHIIDENQRILQEKERLEDQLRRLRGERMIQDTRLTAFVEEREQMRQESEEMKQAKDQYQQRIEVLEEKIQLRQAMPEFQQAQRIQDLLITTRHAIGADEPPRTVDLETMTAFSDQDQAISREDVDLAMVKSMAQRMAQEKIKQETADLLAENQILKQDTIKLHYNLANLFFEQGRYELAASEYRRVAQLMPQDSATHYNLAFVAENYLDDLETALKHYARYIQLEPDAPDAMMVKNKISRIKLQLRAKIDSMLERE